MSDSMRKTLEHLGPDNPIILENKAWLNSLAPNLWDNLDAVTSLPKEKQFRVLYHSLSLSCQMQNASNILVGRYIIWNMPKEWVCSHIEKAVEETLDLEDDWEYRRLLEVYYYGLDDQNLLNRLIQIGLRSDNPENVEAAQDFAE